MRRGLVWRRRVERIAHRRRPEDLLPGIASLFNGALFRASTLEAVGVPDLRLFVRGDEVEMHRRLVRSGLPFGTCLDAVVSASRRAATSSSRSSAGGCTRSIPTTPTSGSSPTATAATCMSQPGMRKLLPQEWLRFGWFFLVSRRDPAGLREWIRLRRLGRREKFERPAWQQ